MWRCLLNGRYTRNAATSAMCAHHRTPKPASRRRGVEARTAADSGAERVRDERAGLLAVAGDLEDLREQLGGDDAADHRQDHQRVAVVGQARRARDEPPLRTPTGPQRARSPRRRSASPATAAQSSPSNGAETTAWMSPPVTMFAVPTVSRTKPQKIPRCRIAARGSLNIFVWMNAYSIEPDQARRDVVERARARRRAPPRRRAGGAPSPAAKTHAAPQNSGEDQRVERDVLEDRVHRRLVLVGRCAAARGSVGSAGPVVPRGPRRRRRGRTARRASPARGGRIGSIASSDSSAPFGLPGTLTIRRPPQTPTTPRDRSAIGVFARPSARIASARPGHLVVDHGERRLRRDVARREAVPPVVTTSAVARGAVAERGLDRRPLVRHDRRSTAKPERARAAPPARARLVLARRRRRPVADREHERRVAGRRARSCPATRSARLRGSDRRPARPAAAARRRAARPPAAVGRSVPLAALAAGLRHEPDRSDLHAALDALDHVVDRQRGHGRRGQRLHLDAGRAGGRGLGADAQPTRRRDPA